MKHKIKLYEILPICMLLICVLGMCLIGARIFSRRILIAKLGIENKITCALGDYNWGDRLERTAGEDIPEDEKPERLKELETILSNAPSSESLTDNASEQTGKLKKWSSYVTGIEDDIEKYSNEKFMLYAQLRKISRTFDALTDWDLVYARAAGTTYTLRTGFNYKSVAKTDMTENADKLIQEKEIAQNAGIDFLYVQYPYRVDEEGSESPWGADAYENENADDLLLKLDAASVDTIDLRKELASLGWENDTGFYESDGHWTTRSGFMSAGVVASYLNKLGYSYSGKYFDEENYSAESYQVNNGSVDETVELFIPQFETDITVIDAYRSEYYEGAFEESCLDMAKADTDEYSTVLTAYSASRIRNSYLFEYVNNKETENDKRILINSNSFSWHVLPYLALDTAVIDYVYEMTPEQMEYYIDTLHPDMVIVMDRP